MSGILSASLLIEPSGARASDPPSGAAVPALPEAESGASRCLLTRRDLCFGLGFAGAALIAAKNDLWLTEETVEAHSRGERDLAALARPLGSEAVVAPALVAAYAVARIARRPAAAQSVVRIAVSVGASGVGAIALKQVVGRARPEDSPGDATDFQPFSGHDSFPSGHATVAFAAATALHREIPARWVAWVAYPVAALVGWSRVHDEQHWTSDVVAGAALGIWTAEKAEDILRSRAQHPGRMSVLISPGGRGILVGATRRF